MQLAKRIDTLENAHRALHARHEALAIMCRMLFPLVNANPCVKQQLTTRAYDLLNDLMEANAFDDEWQALVRKAMDELTKTILADD